MDRTVVTPPLGKCPVKNYKVTVNKSSQCNATIEPQTSTTAANMGRPKTCTHTAKAFSGGARLRHHRSSLPNRQPHSPQQQARPPHTHQPRSQGLSAPSRIRPGQPRARCHNEPTCLHPPSARPPARRSSRHPHFPMSRLICIRAELICFLSSSSRASTYSLRSRCRSVRPPPSGMRASSLSSSSLSWEA